MRAGSYETQPGGFKAFIPNPLPPEGGIRQDDELTLLLSNADRAIGRLDGIATILPNPDLFVAMYVRQEAVLSSQIEGTQSTLGDVLQFEAKGQAFRSPHSDVREVLNYVDAMNYSLGQLPSLPLSLRLIRETHRRLMKNAHGNVRGVDQRPGEFRQNQNWVGAPDSTIENAEYVPPPPHVMNEALRLFEIFLNERDSMPVLVHCGLAHAQFETIHPFLDGNGRIGRLLITLLLCERGVLQKPLLYLSYYLKAHRAQYYDRLTAIRNDGDWEGWLKFFLRGVHEVSEKAADVSRAILALREEDRKKATEISRGPNGVKLLDRFFHSPFLNVGDAEKYLDCSYATANSLISRFVEAGIVKEVTGNQRGRIFLYTAYFQLFEEQALTASN